MFPAVGVYDTEPREREKGTELQGANPFWTNREKEREEKRGGKRREGGKGEFRKLLAKQRGREREGSEGEQQGTVTRFWCFEAPL